MDAVVDVILPTRNRAELTAEAIESVRQQRFPAWRLVVVDDASDDLSDATVEAMTREDERITFLRSPTNVGPQAARQLGYQIGTAPWVALLDSDDRWSPTRLEAQLAAHAATGDAAALIDVVAGAYRWSDHEDAVPSRPPPKPARGLWLTNNFSTVLVRRSALDRAGGFVPRGHRPLWTWEHLELGIRLGADWDLLVVPEVVAWCRRHAGARASDLVGTDLAAEEAEHVLRLHATTLARHPASLTGVRLRAAARCASAGHHVRAVRHFATAVSSRPGLRVRARAIRRNLPGFAAANLSGLRRRAA